MDVTNCLTICRCSERQISFALSMPSDCFRYSRVLVLNSAWGQMGAETVHKEQTCRKVASSKKQHESQKEGNHAARRKFPRNAWGEKKVRPSRGVVSQRKGAKKWD